MQSEPGYKPVHPGRWSGLGGFVFLLLIVSFILLPTLVVFGEEEYVETVYLTKMEALKLAFPNTRFVKKKKVWLSEAQREAISNILEEDYDERRLTWYIGLDDKKEPLGYMVVGNEIGRSYPITFMVVINPDGTVRDVEIMVYREPHGWEVRFEPFMSQFFGRDSKNPFNDINNITGATLSVRSMTRGVKKAVAAYKVIFIDKVEGILG
ncbi:MULTISPECIES: FMN-binding protein [unclassified Nitrospina]|uniref:FMN-binding protein n=1 Tax=unclassified Nitrospina TaxID=2638683 RepID=UPI003F980856